MLVKDLVKYLTEMDQESVTGFIGNGTWNISGMRYGKREGASRGYVLLTSSTNPNPEHHTPPIKDPA